MAARVRKRGPRVELLLQWNQPPENSMPPGPFPSRHSRFEIEAWVIAQRTLSNWRYAPGRARKVALSYRGSIKKWTAIALPGDVVEWYCWTDNVDGWESKSQGVRLLRRGKVVEIHHEPD